MVATTLHAGDAAIVTYNADAGSLTIMFLKAVGAGTTVYLSDRAWNGSAFVAAAGDGTLALVVGPVDFDAGLAVTLSAAQLAGAGISLSGAGETLYLYQGSGADPANTPARFLFALEAGDGDAAFSGSLAGTGLAEGLNAVALAADNAAFASRLGSIQQAVLNAELADADAWVQNDANPQPTIPTFTLATQAPDVQLWVAGAGGGEAIVTADADGDATAMLPDTLAYRILHLLQNDPAADQLYQPRDVALDTVGDRFFFVDADANGHNRIVQGSISALLADPGAPLDLKILYSNAETGFAGIIHTLSIDTVNGKIYFDENTRVQRIDYDVEGQIPTVLADLSVGPPDYGSFTFINQITIDYDSGTVHVASSYVARVGSDDFVPNNRIFTATAGSAASLAAAGDHGLVFIPILFTENDTVGGVNNPNVPSNGIDHWPKEKGALVGVDVDPSTNFLYIVTRTLVLDVSAAQDNSELATFYGGVFRYDPVGGSVTELFRQDGTNGPTGQLSSVEADPDTGLYYVTDATGGGVWAGSLTTAGTPALFASIGDGSGLLPAGLEIQHAPTLAGSSTSAFAGEAPGNPSPTSPEQQPATAFVSSDADSGSHPTDQLAGAQVRISEDFLSGAGHQDRLTIDGAESGDFISAGGQTIGFSYDATTGVLTLSGAATRASYQEALTAVRFSMNGDNPTDYGAAQSRTISYSVFDGLLYSDEVHATLIVIGVNDAPVNGVPGSFEIGEDAVDAVLAGLSVADPDADPAAHALVLTFAVGTGTLEIDTGVAGGLSAGAITGGAQNSGTITITATQNQIEATLAAGGLTFTPPANFNGQVTLTMTTSDQGATGQEPTSGGTGTPTDERDVDQVAINVAAADDPAAVAGDSATVAEDGSVGIDVLANDSDIDSPLAVAKIDDADVSPGDTVTLDSGARVTLNMDGTLTYDPNDAFDALAQLGSGASNTTDSDSFDYTLAGGGTATVDVTVQGAWSDPHLMLGTAGDDAITGTAFEDIFSPGSGADMMTGLGGDDVYEVDEGGDQTIEASGEGHDEVRSTINWKLHKHLEGLTLLGAATMGTGNELANTITGNAGNNVLDGLGGADTMSGEGGDDLYFVQNSADQAVETSLANGTDTVVSSASQFTLGAFVENLILVGNAVKGTGNGLDNLITGNARGNIIDGKAGADQMRGGAGDDLYHVDAAGDQVIEGFGGGNDIVRATVSYIIASGVNHLELAGTALNGTGNEGGNRVTGNALGNLLKGLDGNDRLTGNGGDDKLVGGKGNDMLQGDAGADRFYFTIAPNPATNVDDILDFSVVDDSLYLNRNVFPALGPGTLSAAAFHTGAAAADAADRIIYDPATGDLFYDRDGTGGAAQLLFATVAAGTALTHADFVIYG